MEIKREVTNNDVARVLRKAAKRIRANDGRLWTRGTRHRLVDGEIRSCAIGTLEIASGVVCVKGADYKLIPIASGVGCVTGADYKPITTNYARTLLKRATDVLAAHPCVLSVIAWNDHPHQTAECVANVMDDAANRLVKAKTTTAKKKTVAA